MQQSSTQTIVVTDRMTAAQVGSGLLPVYATPMAAALMENTACQCIDDLQEEDTTVGVRLDLNHVKASAIGETLTCTATLIANEGRNYRFDICITNRCGETVASCLHERVRVNKQRFMQKLLG